MFHIIPNMVLISFGHMRGWNENNMKIWGIRGWKLDDSKPKAQPKVEVKAEPKPQPKVDSEWQKEEEPKAKKTTKKVE